MVWLGYLYVPITNEPRNSPGNRTGRCETRAAHNSTWTAASSQLRIVGGYFIHLQKCDSLKHNATCKPTKKKWVCSAFPLIVIKIHPVGKVSAPSVWKQITMGRCAFRKSQKSVQNYANQHGTLCASNHLFRLMFGAPYGSKIRNRILDAASYMQSLF